jgi:hypothetical protein
MAFRTDALDRGASPELAKAPRRQGFSFTELALRERGFLLLIGAAFLVAGVIFPYPDLARWFAFLIAGYAVVGNDSIQTIGTFISSNPRSPWWVLWLFIGGLFVATILASWFLYDGDVSYQRLAAKGFTDTPVAFSYLQVAAPIFLLILTRMRMPVSTSILLLTSFATSSGGVGAILSKSLLGYALAFGCAMALWLSLGRAMGRWFSGEPHPAWRVGQWITSGFLWSVWIMQDAANVAVYLPRQLSVVELLAFIVPIFAGLGLLFYWRGERVQAVVDEKSDVVDVRPATIIDVVYAAVLWYFTQVNNVPMSTTWVFLGLLGGRELALALRRASGRPIREALELMFRDMGYAGVGLAVSLIIAISVNEGLRRDVMALLGIA